MTTNKDTDLREALRRRYAATPTLPSDFTDRLKERMDTKPAVSHWRRWWCWMSAAAACLLLMIGIGVYYKLSEPSQPIAQSDTSNRTSGKYKPGNQYEPTEQSVRTNQAIGTHQPNNRYVPTEQSVRTNRTSATYRPTNRTHPTEIPDTLGSGIWRSERNVALAIQMLSECETTILREEQEMRNHIIQATFNATPQPANVVLVTNEAGDYEVIETKTIIEI